MNSLPLNDADFIRGNVPMTKAEIRTLILSRLRLTASDVLLDIGAGTGALSIEAACTLRGGKVIAVEKNPEAVQLIRSNCAKFGVTNLELIQGTAPSVLEGLAPVDKAFAGGSSGRLTEILEAALALLKPGGRLAAVTVTLQSLAEAERFFMSDRITGLDVLHASLSRYEPATGIMRALNPVYIFSANKE